LYERYAQFTDLIKHFDAMQEDIANHVDVFREEAEEHPETSLQDSLTRYSANVIVDHSDLQGAPVVVENNPSVIRLLGLVEHEAGPRGAIRTDFSLIRGGALHHANGGFLVLKARDLFVEPNAWESLKRALLSGTVCPDDPAARGGATVRSLDPQPIQLDLKVILLGPLEHYFTLYSGDEEFRSIFKVAAEFDEIMDRNRENEMEYATFIASRCREEGLLHFDRPAVSRVIEHGSRIAGSQKHLTTKFGIVADLVRESSYWAAEEGRSIVHSGDVLKAFRERIYLRNRPEIRLRERILDGTLLIATEGEVVGQINSLTIAQAGGYRFGQPVRVTGRTFMGKSGVVQIDREVHLSGPIHNKGVMTLTGYLGGTYAEDQPLSLSAQITFEQTYGGIEGDSASAAELFALLSSLSGVGIKQSLAITGSVNQRGEIQAIGAVSEKVESWFELCKSRGFRGDQGIVIPTANIDDLMLDEPIREAVDAGEFHLWSIESVDEGLGILTGRPAAEVHDAVKDRLLELAKGIEHFGKES
jgi:lon-related putative ATP-dependent protease